MTIYLIISVLAYFFGWYLNNCFNQPKIKNLEERLRQAYNRKGWLSVKYKKLYCLSLNLKSQISRQKNIINSYKKRGKNV